MLNELAFNGVNYLAIEKNFIRTYWSMIIFTLQVYYHISFNFLSYSTNLKY